MANRKPPAKAEATTTATALKTTGITAGINVPSDIARARDRGGKPPFSTLLFDPYPPHRRQPEKEPAAASS